MSKIYDLFGFPLDDRCEAAEDCRKRMWCRFRNDYCDGGGNRYLSQAEFDAAKDADLIKYFGKNKVQSGVCSLDAGRQGRWIVCPRRLFTFKKSAKPLTVADLNKQERQIFDVAKLAPGKYGIWKEVKIKYSSSSNGLKKIFDYTFDYVAVRLESKTIADISKQYPDLHIKNGTALVESGYTVNGDLVMDVPLGAPLIIEIMTCSTSGGNKAKGTTITQAFVAAVRSQQHEGPGINYRQVWARMVSQLVVKSEVAVVWGGRTLWIIQDTLAEYIRATTALDLKQLVSSTLNEVNMIACGYGSSPHELDLKNLYAGTIEEAGHKNNLKHKPYYLEIIKAPVVPPLSVLQNLLLRSQPDSVLMISESDK